MALDKPKQKKQAAQDIRSFIEKMDCFIETDKMTQERRARREDYTCVWAGHDLDLPSVLP